MRLAILSDIHGNIEALTAVLADIDALGLTDVVTLGDNVGYGPRPEEVVALLRLRAIPSVMGNHEAGLAVPARRSWFNPVALRALDITRSLLSPGSLAWTASLPACLVAFGCRLVHGAPPDSINTYLYQVAGTRMAGLFGRYPERLCFAGHTHDLGLYTLAGDAVESLPLGKPGPRPLDPALRHIVNAGSVGQPRDGDIRAKYVIYDDQAQTLEVRRLDYDALATAREIEARGIPEVYARRVRGD